MALNRLTVIGTDRPRWEHRPIQKYPVTSVPEAVAALARLVRPGGPRWAVTGWAGCLVGPWSDTPKVGRDQEISLEALRALVSQLLPAAAKHRYPKIVVPEHITDATEQDFYIRSKQLDVVPAVVLEGMPALAVIMPRTDLCRFRAPIWCGQPVPSDARLLALHEIWRHLMTTIGDYDDSTADLAALVAVSVGPTRWDGGAFARHHPGEAARYEGKSAAEKSAFDRMARQDIELVVNEILAMP